jgi:SAM-dependent methyltransferase
MARLIMRSALRDAALVALQAIDHGDQHFCPICETRFARFMRRGSNLMCVGCRSFARHRLMVLYLQRETKLLRPPGRILHIAPEPGVHAVLSATPLLDNVTVDIDDDADVRIQADARDLPFQEGSFDAVLCSHVLEHIPEDIEAAREIARVLTRDGIALIQVPVEEKPDATYETFAPTPADREREYGQHDHVRIYAGDVESRLDCVFRTVKRIDYAATFDAWDRWRMGLVEFTSRRGEDIYVCSRAARKIGSLPIQI